MTERKLHTEAWQDFREDTTDQFIQCQRKAFLAGFEAAAHEAESFNRLRDWCQEKRDDARERSQERDDVHGKMAFAECNAYVQVLVKLSEMGCKPEESDYE